MEIAIMIEGQMGLNWPRWQRMARAVEDLGFAGLYRSDHFTNADGPVDDSLDLWVSLTWLADNTDRIEFGPLVTPFSFRHPAHTVRWASAVDDLSNGRLTLGLGAGWQAREHAAYSFDLLDVPARFARYEEGLQIVTHLLQNDDPLTFDGAYYQFHDAELKPRPQRPGGPRILIGGNGPQRTLPLAARFAHEWNAVYQTPDGMRDLNARLDELLREQGRAPGDVRRSLMTGLIFGRTEAEIDAALQARGSDATREAVRARGVIVGVGREVQDQLGPLAEAGVQRVMLQWFDLDDLDRLEAFAQAVL